MAKVENFARTLELSCPSCSGREFGLRVLADEDLAAAHCTGCASDFLVLDSEDHWFDAIQAGYPRPRRCSCKAESFRLSCDYFFRDEGDVKAVNLMSACQSCGKTRHQMSVDIDYGPTDDLLTRPLRSCKTPNLRYDLKSISLYLTADDMARVVEQLHAHHRCAFTCWLRQEGRRDLAVGEVQEAILSGKYIRIYASPLPLDFPGSGIHSSRSEDAFWKRHEVIRISSPMIVHMEKEAGLLYYIQYANEYVDDGRIIPKADAFCDVTKALLTWLGKSFVPWRGKLCFDNPAEHLRLFGHRFNKNRALRPKKTNRGRLVS